MRHIATHEKPDIECELCHRVFGRPDHLKRHIATKHASLSVVEQMSLSESINKKKQKKSPATAGSVVSHVTSVNLPNVLHLHSPKIETTQSRPGSELSTISVAEIATLQPVLQAAPTTPFTLPNQFDYTMFHLNPTTSNNHND